MKKLKLLFILFLVSTLTGCFQKSELEDLAYVIAIGIDKGNEGKYSISFQTAVPIKIAGEGGNGSGKESTSIITLEGETIFNSISRADTMISKKLTLSHNKIIVISEEIAKEGFEDLLTAFTTNREIRPKTSLIIHKGKAKDFLSSLDPVLEKNPTRYYELLLDSNEYTGYTADNDLFHFYLASRDTLISPFALLTENAKEDNASIDIPIDEHKRTTSSSGDSSKSGDSSISSGDTSNSENEPKQSSDNQSSPEDQETSKR